MLIRGALLSALLALPVLTAGWTLVTKAAPWSGRSDPQLAYLNGSLLLLGGHANNQYTNDVWRSTDQGLTWTRLPDAPWAPRSYHTAKTSGQSLFLLAGHSNNSWFNDVWRTSDGSSWELVTGSAEWSPRAAAGFQVFGGTMFLMGGSDGLLKPIGHGSVLNDVWVSTDEGRHWSLATAAAPWPAREGLQKLTAVYEDTIVLTAGEAGYFGPYYNDVWGTKDGKNWTLITAAAGFSKRSGNLLLNAAGDLYTFGGYGFPMKHDAYCLPAGDLAGKWHRMPDAPWHGRFDYDMVEVGSSIVLLAGEASLGGTGGPYFNDVWSLDLSSHPCNTSKSMN